MTPRSLLQAAVSVAATLLAVSFGGCGLDASGRLENPPGSPCVNDAQCSKSADPCSVTRCGSLGLCEVTQVPDGDAPAQATADCQRSRCEGGLLIVEADDADILDDKNDCTVDTCVDGSPKNTPGPPNTPCNVGDAAGTCNVAQCEVQCGPEGPVCNDGEPCTTDSCDVTTNLCVFTLIDGIPPPGAPPLPPYCRRDLCIMGVSAETVDDSDVRPDEAGNCGTPSCAGGVETLIQDPGDKPADEICHTGECIDGVATQVPVAPGTACGELFCNDMHQCVGCVFDTNCGVDTDCTKYTCENEACVVTHPLGGDDLVQTAGDCTMLECDGNGGLIAVADGSDLPPDDLNPCTAQVCTGMTPGYPLEPDLTPCGPGVCDKGTCVECLSDDQCTLPETCGGGGTSKICGCAPIPCPEGLNCGMVPDGCGGMVSCGTCIGLDTCGGGGTANVCGCTVTTDVCADQGKNCGFIIGQCGLVGCGACTAPDSCGGSGVMNVCGCTPNNPCFGKDCGAAVNSCGEMVTCGPDMCPGTQTCTDNVCL